MFTLYTVFIYPSLRFVFQNIFGHFYLIGELRMVWRSSCISIGICDTLAIRKKGGAAHEKTYTNHNDDVCISITKAPAFLHVCLLAVFFHIHVVWWYKAPFSITWVPWLPIIGGHCIHGSKCSEYNSSIRGPPNYTSEAIKCT